MMKRNCILAALCLLLMLLCACGGSKTTEVSMYDLNKALCEKADFGEMQYVSSSDEDAESLFAHLSDMDYSEVKEFFITYAVDGTGNADEIAVIQMKDNSADAAAALQAHLEKRRSLYATYDTSQLDKLDGAIVTSYGDVAILIVADEPKPIEEAFYTFLKQLGE